MKKFKFGIFLTKTSKHRFIFIIFLGFIFIISMVLISYFIMRERPFFLARFLPAPNLKTLALQLVDECKSSKVHQHCYEKKLPLVMDSPYFLNMQQAFEVMTQVQAVDSSYGYCHVTAHYLSEREVRKDPDSWKSVIPKCPAGSCANGCIHGVFMERFQVERFNKSQLDTLSKELQPVCLKNDLWQPTRSEINGCFHALGHTAMYLSGADINQSLDFCDSVTSQNDGKSFVYSCYKGVFMQVFQPLEAEDKALVAKIRPTKEEIGEFCDPYEGFPRLACFSESWPYFYPGLKDPKKLTEFCNFFENKDKNYCYSTVLDIITSNTQLNIDFMRNYCSQLTSPTPGACMGFVAIRLLHINDDYQDWAIDVCINSEDMDLAGECYKALINSGDLFLKNPETDRENFCHKFPPSWQEKCLRK